jgi:hypothetical protein
MRSMRRFGASANKGSYQMAMHIGEVQSVSTRDNHGYGFNLKDSTGRRWITLIYRTQAEANAAREKIIAATIDVIASVIPA